MNLRDRFAKNIIDRRNNAGKIEKARFSANIDTIEKIACALDVKADVLFKRR